ncbi:MAG: hypothetical protein ABJH75_18195, partial [Roseibium sp.]|uniref:hypothetical protein n=1 Tax=Roseibium sp. TaxID=1936156 RepID=UPI003299C637
RPSILSGFDGRSVTLRTVQSTKLIGCFEGGANLPSIQFDNHIVAVDAAALLDRQPDEGERPGPMAGTATLGGLLRRNRTAVITGPRIARRSCRLSRDADLHLGSLLEELDSKVGQRVFFR